MGTKRPLPHDDSPLSQTPTQRPRKRPRQNDREAPHQPISHAPTSVNHLKRKIRDLNRTLSRNDSLPADIRVEKERALAGYKSDLQDSEYEKRKQTMIKKYHMVRFFERQKATRRLKRLKALLFKSKQEGIGKGKEEELKRKVRDAEVDLNYTLYCPLAEKYASLYKQKSEAGGGDGDVTMTNESLMSQGTATMAPRPAMWDTVERCMKDGTLRALRDRKKGGSLADGPGEEQSVVAKKDSKSKKKSKPRKSGKKEKTVVAETREDDTDDGFFEE